LYKKLGSPEWAANPDWLFCTVTIVMFAVTPSGNNVIKLFALLWSQYASVFEFAFLLL